MVLPSGEQYEIAAAGYAAVVTESGAALRQLSHHGRELVDGFGEDEMSSQCRGQLLMPWPNRIRDGRYTFEGRELQLGLTDPGHHNASHGLARWAAWTVEEHTGTSVSLVYRVMAQSGYPWAVDLHVLYDLTANGLVVTQTATNLSSEPVPYASGAHPYLCVGDAIEDLELHLPAHERILVDDRLLPTGTEAVSATTTSPHRDASATSSSTRASVRWPTRTGGRPPRWSIPATSRGVALWVDEHHRWLQVFTPPSEGARPGIAVEPMTAPADAFNSGTDVVVLAPAGSSGDELSVSWGIHAV